MDREKNKGITLIVLVITIIVLLILAGVSIAMLTGTNGILTQAQNAKNKSEIFSEKEAIQLEILSNRISHKNNIGDELFDRNIENGSKWRVISDNSNGKIYGTGWTYIRQGTEVENYGKIKNSWLVNMESGECIQLEEGNYKKLCYGENLAVKDGILLNIDPINMSDGESWGNNVTLKGVEDGYGYNKSEIKLDGQNDYIEIYTGSADITKGLTFEFYGKTYSQENYILNKTIKRNSKEEYQKDDYANRFRTNLEYVSNSNNPMFKMCMSKYNSKSDWKADDTSNTHWIKKSINNNQDKVNYITISIDIENETIKLYEDGKCIGETTADKIWMISGGISDNTIPFTVGFAVAGAIEYEYNVEKYSKIDIYACRLYNKILTNEEVEENYNSTKAYHNLLEKENN